MNPDAAVVTWATWIAAVAAGYLVLAVCGTLLAARPALRRALAAGLLLAIAGGGVAAAAPASNSHPRPAAVSGDWPGLATARRSSTVTVDSGDCLWDIAARRLARPTRARIALAWPRWWHANRAVVGADPDVIRPGQRLRPPVLRSSS